MSNSQKVIPINKKAAQLAEEQELARQIDRNVTIGLVGTLLACALTSMKAAEVGMSQYAIIGEFSDMRRREIFATVIEEAKVLNEGFMVNVDEYAIKFDNGAYVRIICLNNPEDVDTMAMSQFSGAVIFDR